MNETGKRKEITEAITAANMAVMSLERAQKALSGAKSWGIWDMFGGGMFSTMFKHSRMDEANLAMNEAQNHLRTLKRELLDVRISDDFKLEVGDFLSFADYFFDGFVADFMVQSKINHASEQVEEAIEHVRQIRSTLYQMKSALETKKGDDDIWDV